MSSTSRSPDDKPEKGTTDEPTPSKASPGRYSLADDGDEVPATRIDSMTRMPAVRVDAAGAPKSVRGAAGPSVETAAAPAAGIPRPDKGPPTPGDVKKRPPTLPSRAAAPPPHGTQRAMAAPMARGAAPTPKDEKKADSKRAPKPDSKRGPSSKPGRPPSGAPAATKTASASPPAIPSGSPPAAPDTQRDLAPPSLVARASAHPPSNPPSSRKTSSLRPPPAPRASSAPGPDLAPEDLVLDGFDEGSIAFAFDALMSDEPTGGPGKHEFDLAPVRELFAELAANHMRHVRDFMIDVKWGEVTRDWIHICVPPVRTLRRAAEHLELAELGSALEKLGAELETANAVGGQMLDTGEKQRLLDAYGELVTLMPQAFALDRDKTQREAVIVQALLLQVPDVRKVTIDKLHAAGLTSLSVLFDANANDIAHVAGIQDALATRIVERVQAYRAELQSSSPQDARAAEREKLVALNGQLKQHHEKYETAQAGWTPEAKASKREHFRAREETWLEISVLLARLGEVDRLQGIEKVPFTQRITQLSDYIEEARDKYRTAES